VEARARASRGMEAAPGYAAAVPGVSSPSRLGAGLGASDAQVGGGPCSRSAATEVVPRLALRATRSPGHGTAGPAGSSRPARAGSPLRGPGERLRPGPTSTPSTRSVPIQGSPLGDLQAMADSLLAATRPTRGHTRIRWGLSVGAPRRCGTSVYALVRGARPAVSAGLGRCVPAGYSGLTPVAARRARRPRIDGSLSDQRVLPARVPARGSHAGHRRPAGCRARRAGLGELRPRPQRRSERRPARRRAPGDHPDLRSSPSGAYVARLLAR